MLLWYHAHTVVVYLLTKMHVVSHKMFPPETMAVLCTGVARMCAAEGCGVHKTKSEKISNPYYLVVRRKTTFPRKIRNLDYKKHSSIVDPMLNPIQTPTLDSSGDEIRN